MIETLHYYLQLPYPILLIPDAEDGTWYATVPLLPGCMSDGNSPDEAVHNLREAKEAWLMGALEDGDEIAEPEAVVSYLKF